MTSVSENYFVKVGSYEKGTQLVIKKSFTRNEKQNKDLGLLKKVGKQKISLEARLYFSV